VDIPAEHTESKMHGGAPRGRGQHHLIVSLFDAKTGKRIENAQVSARSASLGSRRKDAISNPCSLRGSGFAYYLAFRLLLASRPRFIPQFGSTNASGRKSA
jgi:hypothetical protein